MERKFEPLSTVSDEFLIAASCSEPELKLLHFRLLNYMRKGISLVLVFDGQGRPDRKRGSRVAKTGDMKGLERPLKAHLDLLGIPWLVAGGEAEAELAQMNARGDIDAVISVSYSPAASTTLWNDDADLTTLQDDGDAFVFGCRTLIRNKAVKKTADSPSKSASPSKLSQTSATLAPTEAHVMIYEAATIYSELEGLDQDGMIFFALVSGGDYHDGIPGMGEKIAGELAKQGYGGALLKILRGSEGNARERRLREWRESVKEVLVSGDLGRKWAEVAKHVDASIPDPTAVDLYLNPEVNRHPQPINWDGEIDFERLTPYIARKFEWWDRKVMASFQTTLLEAHLRQQLRKTALAIDAYLPRQVPSVSTMQRELGRMIVGIKDDKSRMGKTAEAALCYRVEISPKSFFATVRPWLEVPEAYSFERSTFRQVADVEAEEKKIYYSIPAKLLEFSFPSVVATFREAENRKKEGLELKGEKKLAREEAKLLREKAKREKALRKENGLDSPVKRGKKRALEKNEAIVPVADEEDYFDSDDGIAQTIKLENRRDWIGADDDGSPSRKKTLRKPRIRNSLKPPPPLPSFASTSTRDLSPPSTTPLLKYSDLESPPKMRRRSSPCEAPLPALSSPPRRFSSVAISAGQSATSTRSWMEDQPRTKPMPLKKERKVLMLSSDVGDVPVVKKRESTYGKTQVVKGRVEIDLCSSD